MRACGDLWGLMVIYEDLWGPMGAYGDARGPKWSYGGLWDRFVTY